MPNETNDMHGLLTLLLTDKHGHVVHQQKQHNHIMRSGRFMVAHMFGGVKDNLTPTRVTHLGVGTGKDTQETQDNDLLEKLVAERGPRKAIGGVTYSEFKEKDQKTNSTVHRVLVSLTAEFNFDEAVGDEPLIEAAIFNADSDGIMYNRVTFAPVTKSDAFKLTLLWQITF